MNGEYVRIWKEAAVVYFKVVSKYLSDEKNENLRNDNTRAKIRTGYLKFRSKSICNVTTTQNCSEFNFNGTTTGYVQ
jgi:hypothetical protein